MLPDQFLPPPSLPTQHKSLEGNALSESSGLAYRRSRGQGIAAYITANVHQVQQAGLGNTWIMSKDVTLDLLPRGN